MRVPRETEPILLAIAAALPLYFSAALSPVSVSLYHLVMGAIFVWQLRRPGASLPRGLLRFLAIAYFVFYFVDGIGISRSLIRATGHLLFFIAAYQAVDRDSEKNHPQRLLVIFLIAIAAIATATHIAISLFVAGFTFLLLRQLIEISREESARLVGAREVESPMNRSAAAYLAVLIVAAIAFFPLLPRVRNPFVRGGAFSAQGAATGFSDSIDLSSGRAITPDPRVVARVTLPSGAAQDFTPMRLRGGHYDRYINGRWTSRAVRTTRRIVPEDDGYSIARPAAESHAIEIRQSRTVAQGQRLFLPVGTWQVRGLGSLFEAPNEGAYNLPGPGEALIEFSVAASREIEPIFPPRQLPSYDVPPEIAELANRIASNATTPRENATLLQSHLSANFEYLPNPVSLDNPVGVEEFLLSARRGHCEHFAAGMVLLLAARGVPARAVGGYYGGEYNRLGGYYVIRQSDAHAWVEVWEGSRWTTWDPTPSDMRPGAGAPDFFSAYLSAVSESINFFWDRYILTFGLSDQVNLILSAFYASRDLIARLKAGAAAIPSLDTGALAIDLGVAALVAVLFALAWRWRRRPSLFDRLSMKLAKQGLRVTPSMTGADVVMLVRSARPSIAPVVEQVIELYERDRFSTRPLTREERAAARMAIKQVKGQRS
ncbi:MAG: transglutaminase TgpA family protein [Thermoanaerobaculia bacterium]